MYYHHYACKHNYVCTYACSPIKQCSFVFWKIDFWSEWGLFPGLSILVLTQQISSQRRNPHFLKHSRPTGRRERRRQREKEEEEEEDNIYNPTNTEMETRSWNDKDNIKHLVRYYLPNYMTLTSCCTCTGIILLGQNVRAKVIFAWPCRLSDWKLASATPQLLYPALHI